MRRRTRTIALFSCIASLVLAVGGYLAYDSFLDRAVTMLTQPPRTIAPSPESFWNQYKANVLVLEWQSRDGLRLSGELVRLSEKTSGTLIVSHGWADSRLPWRKRVLPWLKAGWAVFLFDQRGHGKSSGTGTMGCKEAGDMSDALDQLQDLAQLQAPVAVLGHSLGGVAALRLTGLDKRIRGAILVSTYINLDDISEYFLTPSCGKTLATWFVSGFQERMEEKTGCELSQFDPRTMVGQVHVPVLVIHGKDDPTVPVNMGKQLARALPQQLTDRLFLRGAGHTDIFDAQGYEATKRITKFLKKLSTD